ncbi:uncharacterized protein LACBIDRAFT_298857 [Laccaria bicolor S238N-H82]|uniref:Predicted protein n=1 Tax=Laccaria bicolor (strain S238N-H82 / ATCC MYA-4686) TaxID=486041 RepID=B0DE65_LACBS|nr:uncharacterized protein LACBIDRAFT_298857 [Laccaria bicolor S238N-H82]EDR07086.1 predicted protein [Laccaria bicolor S238N-H82]|eukprot:XP_001882017.1 predicted protein [Laccaria bicolor S238N-H82]
MTCKIVCAKNSLILTLPRAMKGLTIMNQMNSLSWMRCAVKPSISSRRLLLYEDSKSLVYSTIESSLSEYYARRFRTIEYCLIPLHFPIHDSKTVVETKELLITKGTSLYVGLGVANRSAAIWGPDASELWLGKAGLDGTANSVKMPGIFSNA